MNTLKALFSEKNKSKLFPIIENMLFPNHLQFVKDTIDSFKSCKTFEAGYALFQCPDCLETLKLPFSCHSRFCPQCGKKYATQWADSINKQLLNVSHRVGFFTIPKELRCYYLKNRYNLLDFINIIQYIFQYVFSERKVEHFGLVLTIHTFGRDIDFNPHVHFIVTEGGFTKDFKWKKVDYFHYDKIRRLWKVLIFDMLELFYGNTTKFWFLKNQCYLDEKDKGFFVAMRDTLDNSLDKLKYIARYLARPAITEYRIISANDKEVSFWYKHVQTKETINVTLPTIDFLGRLVTHIPPKNFKMVRRFGIYARRKSKQLQNAINSKKRKKLISIKRMNYREYFLNLMGIDILECSKCGEEMKIRLVKWKGKTYNFKT